MVLVTSILMDYVRRRRDRDVPILLFVLRSCEQQARVPRDPQVKLISGLRCTSQGPTVIRPAQLSSVGQWVAIFMRHGRPVGRDETLLKWPGVQLHSQRDLPLQVIGRASAA